MRLKRLEVSRFRNLTEVGIDLAPGLNLFYGDNGAGKTALLEAVHLLCRGRSFRTQRTASLIQHGEDRLVVRGLFEDALRGISTIAIARDRQGRTDLRVDGKPERQLSEVARMIPLQVMLPDIADLVFGGPAGRRSWLDWGTFHVKHEYLSRLRRYLRAVRQRNTVLKERSTSAELKSWSEEVAQLGMEVDQDRLAFMALVTPHVIRILESLAPELELDMSYQRGWPAEETLAKLLGDSGEREVKYGSTLWGPHRADVRLRVGGVPAAAMLSRGQGKMVASALQIGQAALIAERDQRPTVFLIDDAGAELDVAHNLRFFQLLEEIGGQILATTTRSPGSDGAAAPYLAPRRGEPDAIAETTATFHVKHGQVMGEGEETE